MLQNLAPKLYATFLLASEFFDQIFKLNFVYAFQVIVVFFTVIMSSILTNLELFFVYFKHFLTKYCGISLESDILFTD